jgi:hypothetical protein
MVMILGGMLLAAVTYYPLYAWLGSVTQPGNINMPVATLIVAILICYVGMVYGPIGAGLPPEKWSSLMYGFLPGGGSKHAAEETQTRRDRRQVTTSRCVGIAGKDGC